MIAACGTDPGAKAYVVLDSMPDALTNDTHATFTFHDEAGATEQFRCTLDGDVGDCVSPFARDLGPGDHTFVVAAGDSTTVYTWTIDTTPPNTSIIAHAPPVEPSEPVEVAFTSDDPEAVFECARDGEVFAPCSSPVTIAASGGGATFRVRALDPAGNVDATPAEYIAPKLLQTTITAGPASGSTSHGRNVSFEFAASQSNALFECSLDGAPMTPCSNPRNLPELASGPHTFAVRARVSGGLVDPSPALRSWTVDATAPVVKFTQHPPQLSNKTTASFEFTTADPTATLFCRLDGAPVLPCASPMKIEVHSGTVETHGFEVVAVDPFGNAGFIFATWTVDTVPPQVVIFPDRPVIYPDGRAGFTWLSGVDATAETCRLDDAAFSDCSSGAEFLTDPLARGSTHRFEVRVHDEVGNLGSATRTFTMP